MAIVAVHAAIAFADTLSIAFRELKSVDGDHSMAVVTLRHAIGHHSDEAQIKRLGNIIDQKSAVSYRASTPSWPTPEPSSINWMHSRNECSRFGRSDRRNIAVGRSRLLFIPPFRCRKIFGVFGAISLSCVSVTFLPCVRHIDATKKFRDRGF
jgi:hypothetical protein